MFVVVVLAMLGPALLGQGSFGGSDHLLNFDPWRATAPTGESITRAPMSDLVDARIPRVDQWGDGIRSGDLRLWNPYAAGGTGQHVDAFAPTDVPYALLPAQRATAWVALLGIVASALGAIAFLRLVGLSRLAAVAGAVIYTFSGFQVAWMLWPQTHVGAVVPILFWAVERHVQRPGPRSIAAIALTTGWILLEGFPAVAAVALALAGSYGLLRTVLDHRTRSGRSRVLAGALVGGALGLMLAAVALVPLGVSLQRAELERDSLAGVNSESVEAITLVSPDAFGPPDGPYGGPSNAIEGASFVGTGAILLAAAAVIRKRSIGRAGVQTAAVGAAIVLGALVFVDGAHVDLASKLPVLDFNPLTRLRGLLGFMVAVAAAFGVDAVQRGGEWSRRRAVAVGLIGTLLSVLVIRSLRNHPDPFDVISVSATLLRPLLVASIVIAAIGTAVRWPRRAGEAVLLIVMVLVVDGASFASGWWRTTPDRNFYPSDSAHEYLADNLEGDRFAGTGGSLITGTGTFYEQREPTGNAGHTREWSDLLEAVDSGVFVTSTYSRFGTTADVIQSPILDRLSVRYMSYPIGVVVGQPVPPEPSTTVVSFSSGPGVDTQWPGDGTGALILDLRADLLSADPQAVLLVDAVDEAGNVVASGQRRIFVGIPAGPLQIPVTSPLDGAEVHSVNIRIDAIDETVVSLGGNDLGHVSVGWVELPSATSVVLANELTLVERSTSLPRVRWASQSVILESDDAIAALRAGVPADTVVLSAAGPTADGGDASVAVVEDGAERIEIDVEASTAGYVVIADAIGDTWNAFVDGEAVDLVTADHALVAVHVPAGSHQIELSHDRGPFQVGLALSLVAALIITALLLYGMGRVALARIALSGLGVVSVVAITVIAWNSIEPSPGQLDIGPLLLLGLVVLVSYAVVSLEFQLVGRALDINIDRPTAIVTTTIATAANMLPLPGAVITRIVVLKKGGAGSVAAVRVLAAVGGLWLGVSMTAAGLGLASIRGLAALGLVAVGVAAATVGALILHRFGADNRTVAALIATEATMTALGALRFWLALRGLGIDGSVSEVVSVGIAAPLSTAVGLVPAGLGVKEGIAVVLGSLSGLGGAEAGVAAALDRGVGLLVLAPTALAAFVYRRRASDQ